MKTPCLHRYELGVSYSPDTDDGSVSTQLNPSACQGDGRYFACSIFGSSDESDEPSPKEGLEVARLGANSGVVFNGHHFTASASTRRHVAGRAGPQCVASAPEKKAWMPLNPSWITCRDDE
uniref:Uncharacterized protein n=1 Tax=Peronospora matthiolae TaxID=2874970 RepID=A0AAV1U319_9STRA